QQNREIILSPLFPANLCYKTGIQLFKPLPQHQTLYVVRLEMSPMSLIFCFIVPPQSCISHCSLNSFLRSAFRQQQPSEAALRTRHGRIRLYQCKLCLEVYFEVYVLICSLQGYLCPNEFIATQGPLPSTVADFWRMIWETGTRTVAMLTQCYEKGRVRRYRHDRNQSTKEVLPDWTVRTLKVEKHGHYILVKHFNYTSWPEHGVPESCSTLIKFVKAVRAHRHDNSTIVVHCSAGVGRTGVFVALDHLIQHVRDHDFVDIYGLVAELRSERMCMVCYFLAHPVCLFSKTGRETFGGAINIWNDTDRKESVS
uniref:Protein tyrosine phosphatase receptor type O n=1 Tax=Poecilia reticulata TaxID=8081 RepID=A0A3P9NFQ4_POERE